MQHMKEHSCQLCPTRTRATALDNLGVFCQQRTSGGIFCNLLRTSGQILNEQQLEEANARIGQQDNMGRIIL